MSGPYRKPQADIYTVLLALALAAVILATIFAYLETSDYGDNKYKGASMVVQVDRGDVAPGRIASERLTGCTPHAPREAKLDSWSLSRSERSTFPLSCC
jgi:hypothetical protein